MTTSIGFAIHDGARDGRAFQLEEADRGQPLVFGTQGNVAMHARGVLPSHFVLLPHDGVLLAASSDPRTPLYADEVPIGTDWAPLPVPCRLRAGSAVIEIFAAPIVDVAIDFESTRVGPLELPAPRAKAKVDAKSSPAAPKATPSSATARTHIPPEASPSMAVRAVTRLRDDYHRLSRVKRLMLPLAGLLALLAVAQPSQAGERPSLPASALASSLQQGPASSAPSAQGAAPPAALPVAARGPLPSARSLPGETRTHLGPQERVVYHKAIEAMLAGDFQTAYRLYDVLAQAHPEASDIRAAHRVLAAKIRAAH